MSIMKTIYTISISLFICLVMNSGAIAKDYTAERSLSRSNAGILSINLSDLNNVSGVQFQINFSDKVSISDAQNCLVGIPNTHKGAFTTCKVHADKNTILVMVSDIGKTRQLNAEILGFIEYAFKGKITAKDFTVSNLVMMDINGKRTDNNSNPVILDLK